MSSTIPLRLLLTDDRIWQNSASTRGFKARLEPECDIQAKVPTADIFFVSQSWFT